jgi:hypothetical protein
MELATRSNARYSISLHVALVVGIILAVTIAPLAIGLVTPSAALLQWRLDHAALELVPNDGTESHGSASGDAPQAAPVALPDPWNKTHPGFGGVGHYSITVHVEPDALADRALYIPRLSNGGIVEINGVPLAESTAADSTSWRWNRPLYLTIPPDKLRPGDNTLAISVSGVANSRAGLSESFFGPRDTLRAAYRLRRFFQVDLLWIANLTVIVLAIPLLFSWLRDPLGSANYGLFSAGSILFGVRNFHGFFDFLPMPVEFWWPLVSASLGWSLGLIWIFLLRFSDYRWRGFEIALAAFTIAGSAALFMVPTDRFMALSPWLWYVPPVSHRHILRRRVHLPHDFEANASSRDSSGRHTGPDGPRRSRRAVDRGRGILLEHPVDGAELPGGPHPDQRAARRRHGTNQGRARQRQQGSRVACHRRATGPRRAL